MGHFFISAQQLFYDMNNKGTMCITAPFALSQPRKHINVSPPAEYITPFIMNALVLLLLPVALAASPDQRIVNGQNVNIANYPWQVSDYEGDWMNDYMASNSNLLQGRKFRIHSGNLYKFQANVFLHTAIAYPGVLGFRKNLH